MLIGYLMLKLITIWRAEAAPASVNPSEDHSFCTTAGLQEFLEDQTGSGPNSADLKLAYEHCRGEFLDRSGELSEVVKQTVDQWVGTDLSRAEVNQIFLAYELAFVSPKPERLAENFATDCRRMIDQFQAFRDMLEPLMSRIDIGMESMISNGSEEIEEDERELLNFVQYSQFCKVLLDGAQNL